MKKYAFILIIAPALFFSSCSSTQNQGSKTDLSPEEFAAKIKELPEAPLLDVRTPEEFSDGHLQNALNFNWNGNEFENQIETLDKTKPVLVYCRSGSRSAAAARSMRSKGFEEVIEMKGGIIGWSAANLPITKEN